MKKYLFFPVQLFLLVCIMISCASEPGWVGVLPKDPTALFGVGLAEIGESSQITNQNQALQAATQRAYGQISLQISNDIKTGAIDYTQGVKNFYEAVSEQVSHNVMQNSRIVKTAVRGKTRYVLVSYKKADAYADSKKTIETVKNNASDNDVRTAAEKALRNLDERLESLW